MNTSSIRTSWVLPLAAVTLIAFSTPGIAATETKTQPTPTSAAPTTPVVPPATAKTAAAAPAATAPASKPAPAPQAVAPATKPAAPAPTPAPAPKPDVSASEPKDEREFYSKTPIRLEEVEVTETKGTAITMAPTASGLDVYQPQSVVDLAYIANHLPPTSDYSTIAAVGPSVANIVSNGPGLSEARRSTMRGFAQNQYNVTYDSIPFQDSDDLTHHSTSYFPAKMIGRVTVERGPGTASQLGVATFGGTISLTSKDPRTEMTLIPTVSYGSYNTRMEHLEVNTGLLKPLDGASAIASVQNLQTDGYQTNVTVKRNTAYAKYLQPLGKNTTLSFLMNYNDIKWGLAVPVSQYLMDQNGRNYALSNDPTNVLYKEYSKRKNKTDFEYIGVDSAITDSFHINAKGYTYYYNTTTNNASAIGAATQAWHAGHLSLIR
jgi:iron complex outermembrane receptor protein